MTDEELRKAIRRQAVNGKVTCKAMLELAQSLKTPAKRLGLLCNEMKIHITGCQLGCFR